MFLRFVPVYFSTYDIYANMLYHFIIMFMYLHFYVLNVSECWLECGQIFVATWYYLQYFTGAEGDGRTNPLADFSDSASSSSIAVTNSKFDTNFQKSKQ